jgi:hypothetical protein
MSGGMGGLAEEIKNEIKAEKNDASEDRWVSCSLVQEVPDFFNDWHRALVPVNVVPWLHIIYMT